MQSKHERIAKVFKALCDPNRVMIVEILKSGEKCACKLLEELPIGQSTLSHHMKILCESGLVSRRNVGKWTHYSLSSEGCEIAKKLLADLTTLGVQDESAEDMCCP